MKKLLIFFPVFVFSILYSFNSHSLKEAYIPVSEIARSSSDIVVAKCISSEARLDEKTGFVFTHTTFYVDKTMKNALDTDKIELRIIGGQVGDIRTGVEGVPKFDVEQEMVLFLGPKNRAGYHSLASIINGTYRIETDKDSGRKIVLNPPPDLLISSGSSAKHRQNAAFMLLEDFISNIKEKI